MTKNGAFFVSVIDRKKKVPNVWDPYYYRKHELTKTLEEFVVIERLKIKNIDRIVSFEPIEYAHIPRGNELTFLLKFANNKNQKCHIVEEQKLLFGTMRAYLGNVVVTPKSSWLGLKEPVFFPVKSEFVNIIPKDGYHYFWWAYLKSSVFLHLLPSGSGGTRPRLHDDALLRTPVHVPNLEVRKVVNQKLLKMAKNDWVNYIIKEKILASLEKNMSVVHSDNISRRIRQTEKRTKPSSRSKT